MAICMTTSAFVFEIILKLKAKTKISPRTKLLQKPAHSKASMYMNPSFINALWSPSLRDLSSKGL